MSVPGTSNKKSGFVAGVVILTLSNILVRVIGLVLKIPLHAILGDEGMAYYTVAYEIYVWFYMISTAGLPVAASILISESLANGGLREIKRVFGVTLALFSGVGLVGSLLMFFGADGFAALYDLDKANACIAAIAPTLFFVCISSAIRGYFQGYQKMVPTAISQLIEALCKLGIGLLLAHYAMRQGYAPHIVAAYTIVGLSVGVAAGMLFLWVAKLLFGRRAVLREPWAPLPGYTPPSAAKILRRVIATAIPVTLSASVTSFTNMLDGMIISQRLQDTGCTEEMAAALFGNYKTLAVSLFNLPTSLIYPISYAVIPLITEALEKKDRDRRLFVVNSTFRTGALIALPASLGLCVMAKPILLMLFRNPNSVEMAAPLLSVLSLSIFFVGMMTVSNAVLQAHHLERLPILSMAVGSGVKLLLSYLLIGDARIGIYGAPLSTLACYVVITTVNFYFMAKRIGFLPRIADMMVRPLLASVLCALSAYLTCRLTNAPLGNTLSTCLALLIAVAVYAVLALRMRCITRGDLLLLSHGEKIAAVLQRLHLLRE